MKKLNKIGKLKVKSSSLSFLFFSFLFLASPFLLAHRTDGDYSHHGMMGGFYGIGGFGMGLFGWLIGILVITVLILLIVFLSREIDERNKKK